MNNTARNRLIVALDVETIEAARGLVNRLLGMVGMFKIGSQLFTHAGPRLVREIVEIGEQVFLDLKFHDIPNTVAAASAEAVRLGISLFNVHALGGGEMMRRTAEAVNETAARENLPRPRALAVTVLTSSDEETLKEVGIEFSADAQAVRLARLAASCGLDGVVASPHEVIAVRNSVERENFLIVTPGVRSTAVPDDDQRRVMTPGEAVEAGADYIVVGRPITQAENPERAAREILEQINRI
jgi:orotidine-5'-phosphate decarboxylase